MSTVIATNQQVQNFSDQVIRPFCEQARALRTQAANIIASINDVYANLTASNPSSTWTDTRTDAPENLLTVSDLLAINAFVNNVNTAIANDANLPVVLQACVRPVTGA